MKKFQLLLTFILVAPIFAAGPIALAEAGSSTTSSTPSSPAATTSNPDKDFLKLVETEKSKGTQADRVKGRVSELKVKLTAAETLRLKTKCVTAQGLVKSLDTRLDNGVTARSKAYDELLSHLDALIVKFKAAKVSTDDLEAQRAVLKTKVDTFKTDLVKYKIALSDTQGLGCVADPSGFKASLLAARTSRATVAADALAIRTYVTGTIKVTLAKIKDNLAPTSSDVNSSSGTTTGTTSGGTN